MIHLRVGLGFGTPAQPQLRHESSNAMEAIRLSVTAALQLAIQEEAAVQLVLCGDQGLVRSTRAIVGTPYRIGKSADGRARVTLRVAEGTDQNVLIERVLRVVAAPAE